MGSLIEARRRIMMQPLNPLPSAYLRVEYLQSAGAQYIDTGVSAGGASTNPSYLLVFAPLSGGSQYKQYFGGDKTPKALPKIYSSSRNDPVALQNSAGNVVLQNVTLGTIYTVDAALAATTVNGEAVQLPAGDGSNGWGTLSWYVFSSHAENNLKAYMRLYALKMSENGRPVRDFIPCVRKADSKPGLYDAVTKTFYTNAGTGDFVIPT